MCSTIVGNLMFVIIALKSCSSLECYSCGSQLGLVGMENNCEYFSYSWDQKHKQMHCIDSDSVCAKYIVEDNGFRWVHRSCQHYDICSQLSRRYNNGRNALLECETCTDKNFCNSSSLFIASSCYVTLLLLTLFFMK